MTADTIADMLAHYGPMVITAAAAAAAVLPQGDPGTPWAAVRKAIDLLAMNLGNAANERKWTKR